MSHPGDPAGSGTAPVAVPAPPAPPVTGDDVVDAAVALLGDLPAVDLDDQPDVYDGVHRALTHRLADVEG